MRRVQWESWFDAGSGIAEDDCPASSIESLAGRPAAGPSALPQSVRYLVERPDALNPSVRLEVLENHLRYHQPLRAVPLRQLLLEGWPEVHPHRRPTHPRACAQTETTSLFQPRKTRTRRERRDRRSRGATVLEEAQARKPRGWLEAGEVLAGAARLWRSSAMAMAERGGRAVIFERLPPTRQNRRGAWAPTRPKILPCHYHLET